MSEPHPPTHTVPGWFWRATVATLSLVVVIGLAAALWLATRPVIKGALTPAGSLGVWTPSPGAWGTESGDWFVLRAQEANRVVYATGGLELTDYVVEARAAAQGGPDDAGYGLVVRYRDPDEFVALLIGADGYIAVGQMSGGVWRWRVPWHQWPHIRRGESENLLRAECQADRCRFYVNDEFAFAVDAVPAQGKFGPAVISPEAATFAAAFRDWRVWR